MKLKKLAARVALVALAGTVAAAPEYFLAASTAIWAADCAQAGAAATVPTKATSTALATSFLSFMLSSLLIAA